MANNNTTGTSAENSVLTRSVIISCLVLTALFIAALFLQDNFESFFGKYADEAVMGLMLISLWLVVSSTVRSVNSLAKGIAGWKLMLAGVLTGAVSSVLTVTFLALFPNAAKSQNMHEVMGASAGIVGVMAIVSFLISLISLINIRVKNRSLGNLLEFLVIGGSIVLFVYLVNR
jgi:hypothetical protein